MEASPAKKPKADRRSAGDEGASAKDRIAIIKKPKMAKKSSKR